MSFTTSHGASAKVMARYDIVGALRVILLRVTMAKSDRLMIFVAITLPLMLMPPHTCHAAADKAADVADAAAIYATNGAFRLR